MRYRLEKRDQIIDLEETPIALGGEAYLHAVAGDETIVAKIYRKPSPEYAAKLAVMIEHPPQVSISFQNHVTIAWPLDRLFTDETHPTFAGFIMPRVRQVRSIFEYYNPKTRRVHCPLFNYRYLIRTARNLAAAFEALHQAGYVVGDINESNILVSDTALITLVDTDSFQVADGDNFFPCPVGKPEFTPPELQHVHFREVKRIPAHDAFGLAVLIFLLLMEGTHPFAGRFTGKGEVMLIADRIAAGYYPYGVSANIPFEPMPLAPPIGILHPQVRALVRRCFENGHTDHQVRPADHEWQKALTTAEKELRACRANPEHLYRVGFAVCPWCQRSRLFQGWDPFPSREAVKRGEHLQGKAEG